MNVAFRVDASIDIGTGHVMRCLSLAYALKKSGHLCTFFCRTHLGSLNALIRENGFEVVDFVQEKTLTVQNAELSNSYLHWLGTTIEEDLSQTKTILNARSYDWLVVDHYAIDIIWERGVKGLVSGLLVIDDLANRTHDCTILLDQNMGRLPLNYKPLVNDDCVLLLGPHYALLRDEFYLYREFSLGRRREKSLKKILINMGGIDKDNFTLSILHSISANPIANSFDLTVVLGQSAPHVNEVRSFVFNSTLSINLILQTSKMAELMSNADLMIGTAGSTSWERCCLGLPSIVIVAAENQNHIAEALQAQSVSMCTSLVEFGKAFDFIVENWKQVSEQMHRNAIKVTDGKGAYYVAEKMEALIR